MLRTKLFTWLGKQIPKYPLKILIVALILSVISVFLASTRLSLDADQDNLVSENFSFHKRYKDFLKDFGDQEYLYLIVETGDDLKYAKTFVENVAEKLTNLKEIEQVSYKIDNPSLEKNFLLLFDTKELTSIKEMVKGDLFSIKKISKLNNLSGLFDSINNEIKRPINSADEEKMEMGFKFLDGLIVSLNDAITKNSKYDSSLEQLFFNGESFDQDGFLVTGNKKFLLCLIMPAKDYATLEVIKEPLERIRRVIDNVKKEFPEIKAGLTGRPVLAADEMQTSNRDMTIATIMAIIAIGIIFIVSFKSLARPLLAMLSLLVGVSWTYGFVTIVFGTLNLLSIVFAIILVGASIEYGIHVVARYQEELVKTKDIDQAIKNMFLAIGRADMTSALTTAAAFSTLLFTNFKALQQLGVIAAVGIIFCLISMLIVLPALLIIRDHKKYGDRKITNQSDLKPALRIGFITKLYNYPVLLILSVVVCSAILVPFLLKTKFDFNLLNLQAKGLESVIYERKLIDETDESTWFAISIVDSKEESDNLAQKYKDLDLVKKVEDITTYVPLNQDDRKKIINSMASEFDSILKIINKKKKRLASLLSDPNILARKLKNFDKALSRLEQKAFSAGRIDAVEELEVLRERILALTSNLKTNKDADQRLNNFEKEFFTDLYSKLELLGSGMYPIGLELDDMPDVLKNHFISKSGKYAIYVTPKENIWDPEKLEDFVNKVRKIDKNVLGTPVEVYEASKIMIRAFIISGVLAFIVIFFLAYIDFRSVKRALLVCLPLGLGGFWLLSVMGLFNIPFNLANFFAIPIIIGIGVDSGVHIIHRLTQEKELASIGRATGTSVLLTAITNGVGFGMMMIASHKGIASLGQIMVIGTLCTAVAALVVLPPIAKKVL